MTEFSLIQTLIEEEARYKIRDPIRQTQSEWKGALKATRSMGKVLHKVFSTAVKNISQELTPLIESGQKFPISFQNQEKFLK